MPRIDYEAAWVDLSRYVQSRTNHGQRALQTEMIRIAAEHEIPEDLLQRALRLYGGALTIQIVPELGGNDEGRASAIAIPAEPGPPSTQRSHDERAGRAGSGSTQLDGRQTARVA